MIATDLSAASALNAAEEQERYSVGFQLDMSRHAPNGHVASVIFRWDRFLGDTIKRIVAGTWEPSEWGAFVGMEMGVVELAGLHKEIPQSVIDRMNTAKDAMITGTLSPFDGPVYRQDGSVAVPEGERLSDEALWEMNYLVKGAIGTLPSQ